MSGGATPDNTANIYISTDYTTFQNFLRDAFEGFDALKKKGKETYQSMGESAGSFIEKALGASLASAAHDFAATVTKPINTSFATATEEARKFRAENTRLAAAIGQDFKQVGGQLDALSAKTARPQEELRGYAEQVKSVTHSWQGATEGVQGYSELARFLGRRSVEDLAPLSAQMDTLFGVRGTAQVRSFFDTAIAQSQRLGQNGTQAVSIFERLAGTLGKQTVKGAEGERIAKESTAMIAGLQKYGFTGGEAEEMIGRAQGFFTGDLQWMERHLRANGQLGKNESLRDRRTGRLKESLPALLRKVYNTELKRSGGNKARLYQRLTQDQNFGPQLGALVANFPELEGYMGEALQAKPAGAIEGANQNWVMSDEGDRVGADNLAATRNRQQQGEAGLKGQDAVARNNPGGWRSLVTSYIKDGLLVSGGIAAGKYLLGKAGGGILSRAGGTLGGLAMRGLATGAGQVVSGVGAGVAGLGGVLGAGAAGFGLGSWADEKLGLSDRISSGLFHAFNPKAERTIPMSAADAQAQSVTQAIADKQQADLTGDAVAKKLSQQVLRVTIVNQPTAPLPGGGMQSG